MKKRVIVGTGRQAVKNSGWVMACNREKRPHKIK